MEDGWIRPDSSIRGHAEDFLRLVRPASVRLLLTDPPFNVTRENNLHTMGRRGIEFPWDGGFDSTGWLAAGVRTLLPGASVVIWSDWRDLGRIGAALTLLGCAVKRPLLWRKLNPIPRNRDRVFVQSCEFALWAVAPGAPWVFNRREGSGYERGEFSYPTQRSLHPAKKPDGLFQEIIEILTNPGDLVLDPFAGENTTACAASAAGRRFVTFEKDEKFWRAGMDRLARTRGESSEDEEQEEERAEEVAVGADRDTPGEVPALPEEGRLPQARGAAEAGGGLTC